jgi:hypothetical protein
MAKKSIGKFTGDPVTYQIPAPAGGVQMETYIPWKLVKRNVRREVITPIGTPFGFEAEAEFEMKNRMATQFTPLLRALGLAHHWQQLLDTGKVGSVGDIADLEGVNVTHVRRLLRLVLLAPSVIVAILSGTAKTINLESLLRQSLPIDWQAQTDVLCL